MGLVLNGAVLRQGLRRRFFRGPVAQDQVFGVDREMAVPVAQLVDIGIDQAIVGKNQVADLFAIALPVAGSRRADR